MSVRAISVLLACLAVGFVVAGCGGGDDETTTASALPEGCSDVEQPSPKKVKLKR